MRDDGTGSLEALSRGVFQQMLRASLSVQLNVAEGYAVHSPGRTRQHWVTAYGSCIETLDCLGLLAGLNSIPR